MTNSRDKGNNFELQVAKAFSEAFGIKLRRTPLSGGWSEKPEVKGDLVCVDDKDDINWPYCVECKCVEGWHMESLFVPTKRTWFIDWWTQLLDECPKDKTPILVFGRNRMPVFMSMFTSQVTYFTPAIITIHGLWQQRSPLSIFLLEDWLNGMLMLKHTFTGRAHLE